MSLLTEFSVWKVYFITLLIFVAIAETLDCKICVLREKKLILECLEDESLRQRLTLMKHEARVHVLAMNQLNYNVCWLFNPASLMTSHCIMVFFSHWKWIFWYGSFTFLSPSAFMMSISYYIFIDAIAAMHSRHGDFLPNTVFLWI